MSKKNTDEAVSSVKEAPQGEQKPLRTKRDDLLDACREFVVCETKAVNNGSMRHKRSVKDIIRIIREIDSELPASQ